MLDSCSQHTAISGCLFSFSTACSSWIIVEGVSGEGLGGTVILTIIVFICFSQQAWDQFIDNSNNLFACAFTRFIFFDSLIFQNFTIQLKWWNRTIAVWFSESVTKTTQFPYPNPTHTAPIPQSLVYKEMLAESRIGSINWWFIPLPGVRRQLLLLLMTVISSRLFMSTKYLIKQSMW